MSEYLAKTVATYGGGNVGESLRVIAAWLKFFQKKPSWCRNEQVCQGRKSVKRFVRYNGLNTAVYKNVPLLSLLNLQSVFTEAAQQGVYRGLHKTYS